MTDEEKEKQRVHLLEKEYSYSRFKRHQEIHKHIPKAICVSFDLQKVLTTPHGTSMMYYFSRKYSLYNFTIFESKRSRGFNHVWGECDGKRGSAEISSILFDYVMRIDEEGDIERIYFYADNCVAQNKNRTVMSALYHAVQ